ncbi:hypothetical protein STENM223S_11315 [Streptomyces tendae]
MLDPLPQAFPSIETLRLSVAPGPGHRVDRICLRALFPQASISVSE